VVGSADSSMLALKGPFRAFAGNAMMAARQAAAAAAAALGPESKGCAVQLLPEARQLPGWGSCLLRLQAFNSLPGSYCDTLYVQVWSWLLCLLGPEACMRSAVVSWGMSSRCSCSLALVSQSSTCDCLVCWLSSAADCRLVSFRPAKSQSHCRWLAARSPSASTGCSGRLLTCCTPSCCTQRQGWQAACRRAAAQPPAAAVRTAGLHAPWTLVSSQLAWRCRRALSSATQVPCLSSWLGTGKKQLHRPAQLTHTTAGVTVPAVLSLQRPLSSRRAWGPAGQSQQLQLCWMQRPLMHQRGRQAAQAAGRQGRRCCQTGPVTRPLQG
jgi:hypothetical protein